MIFDWKKLLMSLGVAVVVYFILAFLVKPFLSVTILTVLVSLAVGFVVYQFVAWWEIKKLYEVARTAIMSKTT